MNSGITWTFDGVWHIELDDGSEFTGLVASVTLLGSLWIALIEPWKVIEGEHVKDEDQAQEFQPEFINPTHVRRMFNPVSAFQIKQEGPPALSPELQALVDKAAEGRPGYQATHPESPEEPPRGAYGSSNVAVASDDES